LTVSEKQMQQYSKLQGSHSNVFPNNTRPYNKLSLESISPTWVHRRYLTELEELGDDDQQQALADAIADIFG
jgi:hypothetical protein